MLDNLPRITGAAQVVSGIMSLCVAAAVGRAGVGAPLAAVIGFVALDNIQAGARSMWSNEVTATHGGELIEWSGLVAKGYGEIAYTLVDIGLISKASSVVKMATQTENVIKLNTTTAVKVGQTIKPTEVTISIDKISLNQKNVIELKEFNAEKGTTTKGSIIDGASDVGSTAKIKIEYKPEGIYINQTSHASGGSNLCGPTTCTMTIIDKKGNVANLDSVVKQFDNIRSTGVNVYEMKDVLIKNGIPCESTISLTTNQLRELSIKNQSTIVGVRAGDGGHFIIVDSYKKVDGVGYYMIRDPYNGAMGVRADLLENKLNHNGVILK
ncbi:hypothetical protein FcAc13_11850 [Frischella sp. Ac13]|uniref:Peptidase C39-like domain-containing protein n=1 Tax=Frischella japonica TaxID=2741544 RepID=A0ABR7R0J0_9GAMM|nr:hypothetical protein [Frischella japonica]MBC9131993.1 hypothetical protein [Frischella japonica]